MSLGSPPAREEFFQLHAHLCKALAHPTRLLLIDELRDGPHAVGELAERLGLPQSNVSQHLGVLRKERLVTTRRDGSTVYYGLRDPRVTQAFDLLREVLRQVLREGEQLAIAN
jgi:ArsR family transcriptional regulator